MKNLLSKILLTIMLSSTLVDTIHTAIPKPRTTRQPQRTRRVTQNKGQRTLRRRRNLPQAKGTTTPQQLQRTAQRTKQTANKLEVDAKKSETGKVPAATVVADAKKVEKSIQEIEQQLANLRTWSGDILPGGYSLEEKDQAFVLAAPYLKESAALKEQIKKTQQELDKITTKTYLGFGTPTVQKGKEKEYIKYTSLIKTYEGRIKRLEPLIAEQEIILGDRRSTALKAAYASMAIAALVAGDIYTGGALSGAAGTAVSTIANNIAYYTPSPISWAAGKVYGTGLAGVTKLKSGINYLRGAAPEISKDDANYSATTAQIIEAALKNKSSETPEESWWQDVIFAGLQSAASTLGQAGVKQVKKTLFEAWVSGVRKTTNIVLKSLYAQLFSLASNPLADPNELLATEKAFNEEWAKERIKTSK